MPNEAVILLVDDSDDDGLLVRRAFAQSRILNPLQVVTTGEEAIDCLSGRKSYADREQYPMPELVLLDIKMPGVSGFDVLRWIRLQPNLEGLWVVMLTSSDDRDDVNQAYRMGANSFLIKPLDFERFCEISLALNGHWIWRAHAPASWCPPSGDISDTEFIRRVTGLRAR
jgi:two-component system, response regulator